ncbi:MAG: serine protease [Lachnospiraceae bacterium]|nr:serine protease [Lachnospiraceae bacterium]
MKEHQDSDYSFLQEKIKERPINRKKLIRTSINTATFAVVFGLVACVTFILLEPVIGNWLNPQKEEGVGIVTLPAEEEEMLPEDMVQDENELNQNENISNAVSTVELQLSDYEAMYDKLYDVAKEAGRGMVTVTAMSSNVDWFNNTLESENETTGFIVADNGREILILADYRFVSKATEIMVTFTDKTQASATVKKYDRNTGLAILAVDMSLLSLDTKEAIKYMSLGSSNSGNNVGDLVIAVGSPLGHVNSLCYGNITSLGNEINTIDINYKLMTTDIYGSSNASGAILNTKGQIIGMINQNYNSTDLENQISAIGISELRKVMESMSNGNDITYLGLYVTDVTDVAQTQLSIPEGAYVTDIRLNSPAMLVGIQKGDVVTAIDDAVVTNVTEYVSELRAHASGEEITVTIQRMSVDGYREIDVKVTLGVLE